MRREPAVHRTGQGPHPENALEASRGSKHEAKPKVKHEVEHGADAAGIPASVFESIKSLDDLEKVSREAVWQSFERLAAFIFEKNDFEVRVNTVKTFNKKRRQYDIIARKGKETFLVECKRWSGNRYRLSALKAAVEKHKERTDFYNDLTHEGADPVIVTLIEEEIKFYEGVPVVPISRLDSFINEVDRDEMRMILFD